MASRIDFGCDVSISDSTPPNQAAKSLHQLFIAKAQNVEMPTVIFWWFLSVLRCPRRLRMPGCRTRVLRGLPASASSSASAFCRCRWCRIGSPSSRCPSLSATKSHPFSSRNCSILFWQQQRGCRPVRFGDYPQRLPGVCLVAAQQSKP